MCPVISSHEVKVGRVVMGYRENKSLKIGIEQEFKGVRLNDGRLKKRVVKIAGMLANSPSAPLTGVVKDAAELKATLRFFDNEKVLSDELQYVHRQRTLDRMNGVSQILIIQDTSMSLSVPLHLLPPQ